MDELKPCPFCGCEAVLVQIPDSDLWTAGCNDDLMCWGNVNHATMVFCAKESATRAWNKRRLSRKRVRVPKLPRFATGGIIEKSCDAIAPGPPAEGEWVVPFSKPIAIHIEGVTEQQFADAVKLGLVRWTHPKVYHIWKNAKSARLRKKAEKRIRKIMTGR